MFQQILIILIICYSTTCELNNSYNNNNNNNKEKWITLINSIETLIKSGSDYLLKHYDNTVKELKISENCSDTIRLLIENTEKDKWAAKSKSLLNCTLN